MVSPSHGPNSFSDIVRVVARVRTTSARTSDRHTGSAMDPARKRKIRLVVALTCALLLAGALVYTSFSASSEARQPSQLAAARAGQDLPADRQGRPGHVEAQGHGAHLPGRATARAAALASRCATTARCRTRSARAARS